MPWWRDVLRMGAGQRLRRAFRHRLGGAEAARADARASPMARRCGKAVLGLGLRRRDAAMLPHLLRRSACRSTPPSLSRASSRRIERAAFAELARRFAVGDGRRTAARLKRELARSSPQDPAVRALIDAAVAAIAADQAALHALHEAQVWRAAYWRAAREGLTYRRFFEIADLVGVRVERPRVFDDVHRFLLELVAAGEVRACASTTSTGWPTRRRYLDRLQAAHRRR